MVDMIAFKTNQAIKMFEIDKIDCLKTTYAREKCYYGWKEQLFAIRTYTLFRYNVYIREGRFSFLLFLKFDMKGPCLANIGKKT